MDDLNDRELLEALGVKAVASKSKTFTARQERALAGFEEIQRFQDEQGRIPAHGEDRPIFERLYALRLDRLRDQAEFLGLLEPHDAQGLLLSQGTPLDSAEPSSDLELLAELGVPVAGPDDINQLKHVRSRAEITAAEDIAQRRPCGDFDRFRPLFDAVQRDLRTGVRRTHKFRDDATLRQGQFFVLGGQVAYIAQFPDEVDRTEHGHTQGRLRVVYDNGTESDNLIRSFVRALYKDDTGRRISEPLAGPLFGDEAVEDDFGVGTIYILRSCSDHPVVAAHRDLIHKIGVTGGSVKARIANAQHEATFLLAGVDVVAEYQLYNISPVRLEQLLHRVFETARLDMALPDRFGKEVQPREWFLAPLHAIDDAVHRIRDGSIVDFRYDLASAKLVRTMDPPPGPLAAREA